MDGISPRKSLGQHFLKDPQILGAVADLVLPAPGGQVLEVGPGQGALTGQLLARSAEVLAVEVDSRCCRQLRQLYGGQGRFHLVEADARTADVAALLAGAGFHPPVTAIGNFPYYLGTHLLRLWLPRRDLFGRIGGVLQDEVVERLAAPPGSRQRGFLSLFAQYYARVVTGRVIRPGAFHPPPKVNSRAFCCELGERGKLPPEVEATFLALASVAFASPRKTILNNLRAGGVPPEAALAELEATGRTGAERPGELEVDEFIGLATRLYPIWKGRPQPEHHHE